MNWAVKINALPKFETLFPPLMCCIKEEVLVISKTWPFMAYILFPIIMLGYMNGDYCRKGEIAVQVIKRADTFPTAVV